MIFFSRASSSAQLRRKTNLRSSGSGSPSLSTLGAPSGTDTALTTPASYRASLSHSPSTMTPLRKGTYDRLLSALLEADMIANEAFETRVEQLQQMEERRRARARRR